MSSQQGSLKFGTSGLRGLVSELLGEPAIAYTRAFCEMLRQDGFVGEVLIAGDLRASTPAIALLCAGAVSEAGLLPVDCGAVPTPALALAATQRGAAAIMVTGSHIPDDRNGLKFYRASGEIDKQDEARIVAVHGAAQARDGAQARRQAAGDVRPLERLPLASLDVTPNYLGRYINYFGRQALAGLRVGVYQHSSVGRDLLVQLLAALGAEPVALGRAAGFVPVDTEALRPEDVALARAWAADTALDAIVSTDGDADRPLVSDEHGVFLRGDLVGAMTAQALGADAIVTPVTSNSALERRGGFTQIIRTQVGSPYVIAGMQQARRAGARTVVGFEANGGVLLGSDVQHDGRLLAALPTRDAVTPILSCLAQITRHGQPLSQLAARMGFLCALSDRLENTPQERTSAFLARLDADDPAFRDHVFAARGGVTSRDRQDGLRLSLADGATVHFRASGNAPELRVYVEATQEDDAVVLLQEGLGLARAQTVDRMPAPTALSG